MEEIKLEEPPSIKEEKKDEEIIIALTQTKEGVDTEGTNRIVQDVGELVGVVNSFDKVTKFIKDNNLWALEEDSIVELCKVNSCTNINLVKQFIKAGIIRMEAEKKVLESEKKVIESEKILKDSKENQSICRIYLKELEGKEEKTTEEKVLIEKLKAILNPSSVSQSTSPSKWVTFLKHSPIYDKRSNSIGSDDNSIRSSDCRGLRKSSLRCNDRRNRIFDSIKNHFNIIASIFNSNRFGKSFWNVLKKKKMKSGYCEMDNVFEKKNK